MKKFNSMLISGQAKFKKFAVWLLGGFFIFTAFYFLLTTIFAATNIDSTFRYAWNDVIGWVDFYATGNVNVSSTQLIGYASSSIGFIALDCATSPSGNVCGTSDFKVLKDGDGNLSGYAFNDNFGWLSFSGTTTLGGAYGVSVNPSTGDFSGWAWNDNVGWFSFNCSDPGAGGCSIANYKVKTSFTSTSTSGWLESSTFDTWAIGGAAMNTIMWQGTQPSGTSVKFQIASSNDLAGPWNYKGPDGSDTTYYSPSGTGVPAQINLAHHNNQRYFRYKIFLYSNPSGVKSPTVTDIIINWSP
ncbi:MAG: hypothetical protein M1170_01905 [Patescibacteria group bacterium]|nr:hypothetical protein [Patescibacteria group bacterium]